MGWSGRHDVGGSGQDGERKVPRRLREKCTTAIARRNSWQLAKADQELSTSEA